MDHIRHKIGNGRNISAWYDRWNDNQALTNHISKREVCLAGFNDQSKLCDIVNDNKWKWPDDWLVKYNFLLNILVPTFKDEPDKVLWATKQGKLVKFSTNQVLVWRDIRSDGNKVQPHKLTTPCTLEYFWYDCTLWFFIAFLYWPWEEYEVLCFESNEMSNSVMNHLGPLNMLSNEVRKVLVEGVCSQSSDALPSWLLVLPNEVVAIGKNEGLMV
ncbi:hypothetical protein Tco_1571430 [Tanacetum coccineum]